MSVHGQSRYTYFKEQRFTPVLAQSLRISKAPTVARFAYYHVDLNAGSGYNDEIQTPGSPLNFLNAAQRNSRTNFYAFFVDKDLDCIRGLIKQPQLEEHRTRVHLFHADNSEVLPVVAEFIAQRHDRAAFAVGSLLIDPNGYHTGVPWNALKDFCAAHPRIDVLMNLNVRQFKLERAHIRVGQGKWTKYQHVPPISAFPEWFSRPNWMLTELCQIKGNTWIQLVGRTMATARKGYSSLGFYDLQSERGRAILASFETPAARAPEFPLLRDL